MAQADSVPSSSRQLITGEAARQSTNLQAANQWAVRVQTVDRRYIVGGSDGRVIMGTDQAPPLLWRKMRNRSDEPEDMLKCRCYGADAGPALAGSNIGTVSCVNAAFFLGRLLRRIVLILLQLVSRNKRLRKSALDNVSSNQLVPSRPQGRLR
jgi:hypothetical protein